MRRAACVLLLLSAGLLSAADPVPPPLLKISGPVRVDPYKLVMLAAEGADPKAALIWDVLDEDKADVRETGATLVFTGPPGVYKVKLREIGFDGTKATIRAARLTVTIGDPPPPPPPPGPTPGPNPPPVPPDPAAPFAGTPGLRVLVLYESGKESTYPTDQWYALCGGKLQSFLNAACVAEGSRKGWNVWPKDTSATAMPKVWQDALAGAKPASFPWMLVGNGKAGWAGPCPKDEASIEAKVKEYAQ